MYSEQNLTAEDRTHISSWLTGFYVNNLLSLIPLTIIFIPFPLLFTLIHPLVFGFAALLSWGMLIIKWRGFIGNAIQCRRDIKSGKKEVIKALIQKKLHHIQSEKTWSKGSHSRRVGGIGRRRRSTKTKISHHYFLYISDASYEQGILKLKL